MQRTNLLSGESDILIGKRSRLKRYLVVAMEGYFPKVVQTGPNSLAAAFRTGAPHVGLMATVAVSTSHDGGKSWSDPVEIQPRWDDSRGPCIGVNRRGEIIVPFRKARTEYKLDPESGQRLNVCPPEEEMPPKPDPNLYWCKSADGSRTWSEAKPSTCKLVAGGTPFARIIQAPDGTLLMPFYGPLREGLEGVLSTSILLRSADDGETWGDETIVAHGYNETAHAFLPDGRMIAAARSDVGGHTAILFSDDLGRTWTTPRQVTRDKEHPADLTVLQSGKVLLTYGRRIRPMGCGALLSNDSGETWDYDREVLLAGDGVQNGDLGYPSTVQLDDGTIITLLYYASGSEMTQGYRGWGLVSCQAIHYREQDIT